MKERGQDTGDQDWFAHAFDDHYPSLYGHRDLAEARDLINRLRQIAPLDSGRLLDLGCGTGRFLQALDDRPVRLTGLDLSEALLRVTRRSAPSVPLVRGDMRSLPFRPSSFRWVLMMFTTFGYFVDDKENQRVLSGVAAVLEKGGSLLLDTINATYLRRNLVPSSERLAEGWRVKESRWFDSSGLFLWKKSEVTAGSGERPRVYWERLRLYTADDIEAMIRRAGMRVEARLGDYDGNPFDQDRSPRLLVLSRREGGSL